MSFLGLFTVRVNNSSNLEECWPHSDCALLFSSQDSCHSQEPCVVFLGKTLDTITEPLSTQVYIMA